MPASYFAVWLGSRARQHSPKNLLTQEIGLRVSKAIVEKTELNLSNMDVVAWDEPFLVFLKQSKFIGKALVDRSKVDFSRCSIANCTGSVGSAAESQRNSEWGQKT